MSRYTEMFRLFQWIEQHAEPAETEEDAVPTARRLLRLGEHALACNRFYSKTADEIDYALLNAYMVTMITTSDDMVLEVLSILRITATHYGYDDSPRTGEGDEDGN